MPRISTDNYDTVASWNGSQDLFVVEQADGTKVATPAQIKQYVLGDMDEVPTQNSNNPVKSGGVYTALAGKQNNLRFDNVPTQNSNNPVKSGGIYSKIGDLTQTGLTGDSVAAQLAAAKNQIAANAFANIVRTATATGTTNGYGDVQLGLNNNYLVLSVTEVTNSGGCYAIPRLVESGNWYACVYRQNAKLANTSVTLQVKYVPMT